jgi:uncharacterized membrane protein YgcG
LIQSTNKIWRSFGCGFAAMKNSLLKFHPAFLLFLLCGCPAFSQSIKVSGQVVDGISDSSLISAYVFLYHYPDTAKYTVATTDIKGNFTFNKVKAGPHKLKISYLGFTDFIEEIQALPGQNLDLGKIKMSTASTTLKSVVIVGKEIRTQQQGDTTQYNANAFKTNPDATAEDLVNKMPGITSQNGTVTSNGETVAQVLVDGKPFFGDDPTLALKNLPAEVIDKIQVFDKLSDQSQFTGFDDGNSQKTINIITKQGKSNGDFGKIFGGYGTDNRYILGGNINFFDNNRRISILGLTDNVNQQNFSTQDLLGVFSNSGSGQFRGGSGGSRGGFSGSGRGGSGGGFSATGNSGGAAGINNFLVGQQGGITKTNAFGINYSDQWGKKIKISASYFFNNSDNTNNTTLTRDYVSSADSGTVYNQTSESTSENYNHRFNLRFEYDIDTANSLIITPKFTYQKTNINSELSGVNSLGDVSESSTISNTQSDNSGYDFSNNVLFMHRFKKRGRTISLNIGTDLNNKTSTTNLFSLNAFAFSDTAALNQQATQNTNGHTLSSSLSYTEPVGKKALLQFNYSPSITESSNTKNTFNFDSTETDYSLFDTSLSNQFKNKYFTQRGGINFRLNGTKYFLTLGAALQDADLASDQQYPYLFSLDKSFINVLPSAMLNFKFSKTKNLRIMYRGSTTAPSISQLQNVVDNTNPLLLSVGNPALKQDFEQSLIVRYGSTNTTKATTFLVYFYLNYIDNYLGNETLIPTKDTTVENGIALPVGSQLTMPVNLNGYWNTKAFVTLGLPLDFMKCNLNFNTGFTFTRSPALINELTNFSNSYSISQGIVLSSNISQNVDFTLSYNGNYNIVQNTLQSETNENYYSQILGFKFNWIFAKGFVANTSLSQTSYSGLGAEYDQDIWLWNALLGYKFFKAQSLEIAASANDILNQNKSISQNITDTYIENSTTQVLQRYFMLNITYTIRDYKK